MRACTEAGGKGWGTADPDAAMISGSQDQPTPRSSGLNERAVALLLQHRVAARDLSNGRARSRPLKTDRPLLLVRPEPLRPTRHRRPIVSTIHSGHYRSLLERGRAITLEFKAVSN